jgi:DMSO reductase anchor subunit
MHPAYSVIFFTTASGAGYGLLFALGVLNFAGLLPTDRWFGLAGLVISLGLITAGLLSSTFHLGHPVRAWRAFSQWRSSWLSREGVASVITYGPAAVFGYGWVFLEQTAGLWAVMGLLAAVGAVITVYCTSMIYVSLRTIAAWHNKWVTPGYLLIALATGLVLMDALLRVFGAPLDILSWVALACFFAVGVQKSLYWRFLDNEPPASTLATATGLGEGVKMFDPPHTGTNYLREEMGYKVARKHAEKLHKIAYTLLVGAPCLLLVIATFTPAVGALLAVLAALSAAIGVVTERWLFFAEAKHVVSLYYGDGGH